MQLHPFIKIGSLYKKNNDKLHSYKKISYFVIDTSHTALGGGTRGGFMNYDEGAIQSVSTETCIADCQVIL